MRVVIVVMLLFCLAVVAGPAFAWAAGQGGGQAGNQSGAKEERLSRAARDVLSRAVAAQEKGDRAGATSLLREYVAAHPGGPGADPGADAEAEAAPAVVHLLLGNLLFESGEARAAVAAYGAGLAAYPDDPGLCRNLAVARMELGEHAAAAELFERAHDLAVSRGDENGEAALLYQAAAGWYRAERPARAVRALDRLLATGAPAQEGWLELLAHCCLENGDAARAQSVLERLTALVPGEPRHWRSLARVRLRRENHAGAAAALEVCTRLGAPRDGELDELASVYLYLDAPLRAAETLVRAHGARPDRPEILDRLFEAYARAHRAESALAALGRALELAPTADRLKRKGGFLFEAGRFAEAEAAYARALELAPADGDAALRAGYAALELDGLDAARRHFTRAARTPALRTRAEGCLRYVAGIERARREAEAALAAPGDAAGAADAAGAMEKARPAGRTRGAVSALGGGRPDAVVF
ncbi:MAG: tetratricopeptide repeat protein [Desulfovibrionaceae bacterium]|jgi:tetratricopeptide (TPR) repeat protein|nr:tetratricopeptide repeat protein [Desulfovibrionaceae bacterium]